MIGAGCYNLQELFVARTLKLQGAILPVSRSQDLHIAGYTDIGTTRLFPDRQPIYARVKVNTDNTSAVKVFRESVVYYASFLLVYGVEYSSAP